MRWFFRILIMGAIFTGISTFLSQNWETFRSAPLTFIGSLLLGFFLGWLYWKSKITEKDKRIAQLQERLGEAEPDSVYRNLTNKQLKNKTLTHTKQLQRFIKKKKSERTDEQPNSYVFSLKTRGEGEFPLSIKGQQYWDKFNPETSKLRYELLKRLPQDCEAGELCLYEKSCKGAYLNPITLESVQNIAIDLGRLAHNLKN